MRTPKTLQAIADTAKAFVEPLKFDRIKRGWAIVDSDNNELMEIAPVHYSNGDRWKVIDRTDSRPSLKYYKSIRQIKAALKPGWTGYKFRSMTTGNKGRIQKEGAIEKLGRS